jgi:hypothetical protein
MQTLLVVEADLRPLRLQQMLGAYSAKLDSYVLIHDRSRDSLQRDERLIEVSLPPAVYQQTLVSGLPVRREFALQPGTYQATVLLRDRATGTIGSVRHEFEVPAADTFRISTPILTDTMEPIAGGQGRPVPIARRTFQAGTRIVSAFEIHGARLDPAGAPRVTLQYSLQRADGAAVAGSSPQVLRPTAAGQLPVTIGVTLPAGASGAHELVLTLRDEVADLTIEDREALDINR